MPHAFNLTSYVWQWSMLIERSSLEEYLSSSLRNMVSVCKWLHLSVVPFTTTTTTSPESGHQDNHTSPGNSRSKRENKTSTDWYKTNHGRLRLATLQDETSAKANNTNTITTSKQCNGCRVTLLCNHSFIILLFQMWNMENPISPLLNNSSFRSLIISLLNRFYV